nr:MAG: hypothetical protein OI716_00905 [Candidatus Methanoperedens sp.]WAI00108.1 MAG: hypothetical protein OI720_00750 [Candidatus Methanoperedens sp.]
MGWYGLDAFDLAIKRTKKALIEPFVFWKWIRLGIITILIGGGGMGFPNFNFPASWQAESRSMETPSIQESIDKTTQFWHQYQTYILIGLAFIIFMILLFTLISSIMEFVFVESLVTNSVSIRAYFQKYLHPGFNLFIVKIILGIIFLSLFILAMIPVFRQVLSGNITPGLILGSIVWFLGLSLILIVLGGIISSFISLAIPVVMYQKVGIITALKKIIGRFKDDWKQIVVYWVVRFFAWAAGAIVVGLAALILFIVILLILLIPALILYFIISALGSGSGRFLFLVLMIPYGLIALVVLIIFLLIVSVPLPVFMKYHLLTFMQKWYPDIRIPLVEPDGAGVQSTT